MADEIISVKCGTVSMPGIALDHRIKRHYGLVGSSEYRGVVRFTCIDCGDHVLVPLDDVAHWPETVQMVRNVTMMGRMIREHNKKNYPE